LHDSAYARLQARMATMPVIQQAKGIVMAQQRCGPEEVFDLLRQMSPSTNVRVHVLAAHIVEQIAASNNGGTVVSSRWVPGAPSGAGRGHGPHRGDSDRSWRADQPRSAGTARGEAARGRHRGTGPVGRRRKWLS